jgi:urea transport system ATP-binding protein
VPDVLAATGINQFYGESHILWDATLELPPGACTCLMGRNGVGKTTFLKVIMGLQKAASGVLTFAGQDLRSAPTELRARLGIGYVPQGREIFPQLDVEENLRIGLHAFGRKAALSDKVFSLFPVLEDMLRRRGGDLSGGQQQQLAIARALAPGPKLLILDEPTEGIQPNIVHEIGDVLMRLTREDRLTVLLVEQKLPFARRVADRFVMMDRGRTVASGAMGELGEGLVHKHLGV